MGNSICSFIPYFLPFLILLFNVRTTICANNYTSICTKTPDPRLCNSLITTKTPHQETLVENLHDLHHLSLRETLARGQEVHNHIAKMDFGSLGKLEKLAWIDCLELYEDTIHKLNQSINSEMATFHDAQTWLSAGVANQDTCKNGFRDFNLSIDHFKSPPFTDLPKYLSNSLVINKAMANSYNGNKVIDRNSLLSSNIHHHHHVSDWDLVQLLDASKKVDVVVAQDGTGDYKTISEALNGVKKRRKGRADRIVIYIKKGVYVENVVVKRSMRNVMVIGDGIDRTVLTASKSVQDGSTTFRSATFGVSGDGFIAIGITFRNTAGPEKHQAVALRSSSDHSVFYKCSFDGYQDTLYVHSNRQFYRNCDISGTVDFIFGDAVSTFQNCNIYLKRPLPNQSNTVTAQGRKNPTENTGIVIHNSIIAAAADLIPVQRQYSSYLGRPWRRYSRTVVMKCRIDGVIDPAGWSRWSGDFGVSTLYYGEYMNWGSGAATGRRVKWAGFRVITRAEEAARFAVGNLYGGDSWITAAGVPVTAGV